MASRGDDTRSRSPRDPGAASSAQGVLRTLDIGKMQLTLESRSAKVLYFKEDDIWFEAKPCSCTWTTVLRTYRRRSDW